MQDVFQAQPGNGRSYTYGPIGLNTSLECSVTSSRLIWVIGLLRFTDDNERATLSARGIFEIFNGLVPSSGITSSSTVVFGNTVNNDSNICCLTLVETRNEKSCTIFMIYGERIKIIICLNG